MPSFADIARIPSEPKVPGKSYRRPVTVATTTQSHTYDTTSSYRRGPRQGHHAADSSFVEVPHPDGGRPYHLDLDSIRNDTSRHNLKSHCQRGYWVDPKDLKFGDPVNMCVAHDIFGPSVRYYLFWKVMEINGQQCPLFLTQITNGRSGPRDTAEEFFQTAISFLIEDRPERNVFINATHVVAMIPPRHGKIFVQLHKDRRGSENECFRLQEHLDHFGKCHPRLLKALCQHIRDAQAGKPVVPSIRRIKAFLQYAGREKCCQEDCTLHRSILQSASRSWREPFHKSHSDRGKKMRPDLGLCAYLTGEGRQLDQWEHMV